MHMTEHCTFLLLNRENLFEEMLQEPGEVAVKRKRTWETLQVLQQAFQVGILDFGCSFPDT